MSSMNIQPRELEDGYVKRCFNECLNVIKSSSGAIALIIIGLVLISVVSKASYVDTGLLGPSFALVIVAAMCFRIDSKQSAYSIFNFKSLIYYAKLMWQLNTVRIFAYICIFMNIMVLCFALSSEPESLNKPIELGKVAKYTITTVVILIMVAVLFVSLVFVTNILLLLFLVMHTGTDETIVRHKINFQTVPELNSICKLAFALPGNSKAFGASATVCLVLNVVYILFSAFLGIGHATDVLVMYTIYIGYIMFQYYVIKEIIVGKPKEVTEESFSQELQCSEM